MLPVPQGSVSNMTSPAEVLCLGSHVKDRCTDLQDMRVRPPVLVKHHWSHSLSTPGQTALSTVGSSAFYDIPGTHVTLRIEES